MLAAPYITHTLLSGFLIEIQYQNHDYCTIPKIFIRLKPNL